MCLATNLLGEVPQAIVDMQSLTELEQFNHVVNVNCRSLDLVFSNVDPGSLKVNRAASPLVTEDDHHPALMISYETTPITYIGEKRSRKTNFFSADYVILATRLALVNWVCLFASLRASECLFEFNEVLRNLINDLPKSTSVNRQFPCWYSKQLIELIREKSKARKKKEKSGNQCDVDRYRDLRRLVKRLISDCHDKYIQNTEDKHKSNSKCFFFTLSPCEKLIPCP